MPMYSFRCANCGHQDNEFSAMKDSVSIGACRSCPKCSGSRYQRLADLCGTDMKEFHEPITMFSIALNTDEEIAAFRRKAPDVEVNGDTNHPDYGLPIARSRKQKLQALKAMDFAERN